MEAQAFLQMHIGSSNLTIERLNSLLKFEYIYRQQPYGAPPTTNLQPHKDQPTILTNLTQRPYDNRKIIFPFTRPIQKSLLTHYNHALDKKTVNIIMKTFHDQKTLHP